MMENVKIEPRHLRELLAMPEDDRVPLLIAYLGTSDKVRLKVATVLLTDTGAAVVPTLLRAALGFRKRAHHRVRLLDIVLRIGAPLAADDWMMLYAAVAVFRGEVGEKIVEVLRRLGHATRFRGLPAASSPPAG